MERFDARLTSAAMKGDTLQGVAHVIGTRTFRQGAWIEMDRGAFERALADPQTDLRSFMAHDQGKLLGRQGAGTLRVAVEGDEVPFEVDLPDTSYAHDLRVLVDRGDLDGASFGVNFGRIERSMAEDGKPLIRVMDFQEWLEVSPVALPAFAGTNLQLHSLPLGGVSLDSQLVMARHRVRVEARA